jgi:hypothetical protein
MENIELYKHYVIRDNIMLKLNKAQINNGEKFLYVGNTPTTPTDFEFVFGEYNNGEYRILEYCYDNKILLKEYSKNKLLNI